MTNLRDLHKLLKKFFEDEKAQVSAELIIVLAALIAVAILLVMQLQNTARKGSKTIGEETDKALSEIREMTNTS